MQHPDEVLERVLSAGNFESIRGLIFLDGIETTEPFADSGRFSATSDMQSLGA